MEERSKINFDEPAAIEWPLLVEHIRQLKEGKTIEMPTWRICTQIRDVTTQYIRALP